MDIQKDNKIGEIVASDYRTAAVFQQNNIDFCCNGDRSIEEVCNAQKINFDELQNQLNNSVNNQKIKVDDYSQWPLDLLADYIVKIHHSYVEKQSLELHKYLEKICQVHGEKHPELKEIQNLFDSARTELASHMKKEELVLFPLVKKMVESEHNNSTQEDLQPKSVEAPIAKMMEEHETEGERFDKISKLSNGYTIPADACNTYKVTYNLLQEFEEDLHKHIHLENNILFPKAIQLEKKLMN